MATILAATDVARSAGEILIAGLLLMAFFLALGIGLWYYRRWRGESNAPSTTPWNFDDLRKLRDQGQLSESEYQSLRSSMIGLYTRDPSSGNASATSVPKPSGERDEQWDWVADDEGGSGGLDVKK